MAGGAAEQLAAIKHPQTLVSLAAETASSLQGQLKACGVLTEEWQGMKVSIVEPQLGTQQAPDQQGLKGQQHTPGSLGSLGQPMQAGMEEESKGGRQV